jgi:hypothetical protein
VTSHCLSVCIVMWGKIHEVADLPLAKLYSSTVKYKSLKVGVFMSGIKLCFGRVAHCIPITEVRLAIEVLADMHACMHACS